MDEFRVCDPCGGHDPVPDPTVMAYAGWSGCDEATVGVARREAGRHLMRVWREQFGWASSTMTLHVSPPVDGELREVWLSCE